jgi:hypothetical protein
MKSCFRVEVIRVHLHHLVKRYTGQTTKIILGSFPYGSR